MITWEIFILFGIFHAMFCLVGGVWWLLGRYVRFLYGGECRGGVKIGYWRIGAFRLGGNGLGWEILRTFMEELNREAGWL